MRLNDLWLLVDVGMQAAQASRSDVAATGEIVGIAFKADLAALLRAHLSDADVTPNWHPIDGDLWWVSPSGVTWWAMKLGAYEPSPVRAGRYDTLSEGLALQRMSATPGTFDPTPIIEQAFRESWERMNRRDEHGETAVHRRLREAWEKALDGLAARLAEDLPDPDDDRWRR